MRALITGAAGLVGSALAAACEEPFALPHRDLDIADADTVRDTVRRLQPEVIFNCAAVGVDECEADPALAERVNVTGPAILAETAKELGIQLVHFSTNYVFDGRRTGGRFYAPGDEAHPVNVYGQTKLRGERAVLDASDAALVVRTSWVFGRNKASFLSTVAERLARGERVQAITDTFASATNVADLVARVLELAGAGARGVHHVVNDGICSYETFALEAARLVGADEALIDRITEARPAPRPRWTPMLCDPPLRPWQEALAGYVAVYPPRQRGT